MCPPLSQAIGSVQNCTPPCRYLCCETQMELREWFATFLFVQVPGAGGRCGCGVGSQGGIHCGEWDVCFFTIQATNCFKGTEFLLIQFVCFFTR